MTPAREVAAKLLRAFPKAPTLTLAKKAYKEYPELWSNLDTCRMLFRRLRGAHGKRNRMLCGDKSMYRKPQPPKDPFDRLPDTIDTVEHWNPVTYDGPLKVGILSDIHIPYHDKGNLRLALKTIRDRKPDMILLNGDIADFYSVSFWETDPRNRDFKAEIQAVTEFLGIVRDAFPKARIVYKWGNHEERLERYMRVKAPELLDLPDFQPEVVLKLKDRGIELVKDKSPIALGALHVLHGHEYKFSISNPVNAARGLYLRAKVSCICGHFHQTSQHSDPRLDSHLISTWSTGCLCDLHPAFMPLNRWNPGFAFAEISSSGAYHVNNHRIVGGKVWS